MGLDNIWWVPILPLIGALMNGLFGYRMGKVWTTFWALGTTGLSFAIALLAFGNLVAMPASERVFEKVLFTWVQAGSFTAEAGIQIDPLSGLFMLIVTGVGFLIHVYSVGYMGEEDAYPRYFSYLNLFMFSMLLLVMGNNFLLMFIGWEGVGLCSYLLIGYYYKKDSAADAGKKAFIMNRIGDFGFLLGIMWIFWTLGSIDYTTVFAAAPHSEELMRHTRWGGLTVVTLITLFLFVGAQANPPRFRCIHGCRTPWKARRRSPRSSMRPPWSLRECIWWRAATCCSTWRLSRWLWWRRWGP